MFRRLLLPFFLALLTLPAFAVAPITVSGTNQTVGTTGVQGNSFVRFRLRNFAGFVPKVFGTGVIVQTQLDVLPAADGTFSTPIWSNDDIIPNTCGVTGNLACTWYTVEFWNGGKISASGSYCIPNTSSTYDLNVAVPCQTPPLPPGPVQVTSVTGATINGTTTHVLKFVGPTTAGDSEGIATGTTAAVWPLGTNIATAGLEFQKANSASPGTTQFLLAAKDPITGLARDAQPTDSNSLIGVSHTGAGTGGLDSIVFAGGAQCRFDNQTSIGDWVILGASSQCHDAGTTQPVGVMSIARVSSVNTGSGTIATVDVGLPEVTSNSANTTSGGNGTVQPCATNGALGFYSAIGNTIGCDPSFTDDGAGNLAATSLLLNGTGGGFEFFGQGTQPTLSQSNVVYFYAPASVPASFGTAWPSAPGTLGQTLVITSVPDSTHVVLGYATVTCPGSCLGTVPTGDQTITGSHQLINLGTGTTGDPLAGFDANIQAVTGTSKVAITGASLNASPSNVGIMGAGQGAQAFGGFTVASTDSTTDDGETPYGIQSVAFLSSTANHSGTAYGVGGVGSVFPSTGKTIANAVGVSGGTELRTNGTLTRAVGVEGFAAINPGGGTITNNYAFDANLQSVGVRNVAYHSVDQGAGGSNYGIYFEGSTHNYMGGGQTVVGSLGLNNATGSTQCLQADSSGAVTGTGATCAGSSSPGGSNGFLQYNNSSSFGGFADGTSTQVLHGGRTFGQIVNADITNATIDLTTKVTGVLPTANGGSTNGFFAVSGPASSVKTFTFPNASATVLTSNAAVTVAQGGTNLTTGTSGGVLAFTASGVIASSAALAANGVVLGGGAGATPFTTSGITTDGSGALTLTGALTTSFAGAASAPAVSITGAPYAAGTGTTTFPLVYINSGTAPTTFSTAGTVFGINSPSGFAGNLIDIKLNGAATSSMTLSSSSALAVSGNMTVGTSGGYFFSGRSKTLSPADGVFQPTNNAGTSLTRLDLGLNTSSGPAFCVSGTTVNVCLGDGTTGGALQVAGTPVVVGSTVTLTSAYTNATTTPSNLTDGTHNMAFSVAASTNYYVECNLIYQSSNTTAGLELVVTGPTSPSAVALNYFNWTTPTANHDDAQVAFGGTLGTAGTFTATTNFSGRLFVNLANGVNSGTVQVQGRAAGIGTVTVQPGSSCTIHQ